MRPPAVEEIGQALDSTFAGRQTEGNGTAMDNVVLLKFFHIFGAMLFLGNIIVTGIWKAIADRTREPAIVAYSQRLVTITDFVFTALGVLIISVSGYFLAQGNGGVFGTSWLRWGFGSFIASGVIWVTILIPVQYMQAKMAKSFSDGTEIPAKYWQLSTIWEVAGWTAVVLPLITLYFMVFKPS